MLFTTELEITNESVYRFMGYKSHTAISKRIVSLVDEAVERSRPYLKATVLYDIFHIFHDHNLKRIVFSDGQFFSGEDVFTAIRDCNSLVIGITSLDREMQPITEDKKVPWRS